MKLATLKTLHRDGQLVVVSRDLTRAVAVPDIAATLQAALDRWAETEGPLRAVSDKLNAGPLDAEIPFVEAQAHSPLPRAYQWVDGSAYVNHVELVRKARNAEMPPSFWTDPLMYQGCSDSFLAPHDPIPATTEDWGIDFEAEVGLITDDVPMGVSPEQAASHIKLLLLVNDVSLRNLIPAELAKGFGFFQSKPPSSFSPVAVTPDELGEAWREGKVHLPLVCHLNGALFGKPNAGIDMTFNFPTLIAHAAKSRPLAAGTILGSGTISNVDRSVGSCCLAEVRMLETIEQGKPVTSFMKFGDKIRIEMFDKEKKSVFGSIDQTVVQYTNP